MKNKDKEQLAQLQQDLAKAKRYLEWSSILSIYNRDEALSGDLPTLVNHLKKQINQLESTIIPLAIKIRDESKLKNTKKKQSA